MADAGERHGAVRGRDHKPLGYGEVCDRVLVQPAIACEQPKLVIDLRSVLVDRDELLVQVLEGRTGGSQPVLEDRTYAACGCAAMISASERTVNEK